LLCETATCLLNSRTGWNHSASTVSWLKVSKYGWAHGWRISLTQAYINLFPDTTRVSISTLTMLNSNLSMNTLHFPSLTAYTGGYFLNSFRGVATSHHTFQSLYASKCSTIISVSIDPTTRSSRHLRFPACFNDNETISAGVVWQPRTRRWSRHTDVAGSSDVSSKNASTRQSDNRNQRVKLGIRCVPRTTPSAVH
jgi:hypothetical protein